MILRRLIWAVLAGVAAAMVSAIVIAICDLYLSGHGYASLTREYVTWPSFGVHLSIGDILLLVIVLLAAALAWRMGGRDA